jgi:hypothetical protein
MSLGWARTNGERFAGYDSAYADFDDLEYKGNSNNWHPWDTDRNCLDMDNNFDNGLNLGGDPAHIDVELTVSGNTYNHLPCEG